MHVLLLFLLGIVFFVILLAAVFVLSVLGKVFSLFRMGDGRTKNAARGERTHTVRKKMIPKDEGEYVDFEEIE